MCLERVHEQYDTPSSLIIGGWKLFGGTESAPRFQSTPIQGLPPIPLDTWVKADTSQKIKADDGKSYEAGFHTWEEEDKKQTYGTRRRRVFIRSVSAIGEQDAEKVLIAQELFIPSDPNGWPPKPNEPTKKESMLDKAKSMLKPGSA